MIRCRILVYLGQVFEKQGVTIAKFEDIADFVYHGKATAGILKSVRDEIDNMGLTVMDCYGCDMSGVYITSRQLVPLLTNELTSGCL